MLDVLTVEDFSGRLGESFRVSCGGHSEALVLTEAAAIRIGPPAGRRRGFFLIFRGDSRTVWLPQGIHAVEHQAFPGLVLFLTCLGPGPGGFFRYEAVFT